MKSLVNKLKELLGGVAQGPQPRLQPVPVRVRVR